MASREEMIAQLKRRDMIAQLKARDLKAKEPPEATPAEQGFLSDVSDFIGSASENMSDMLPGKGIITKAATMVPASAEYAYDRLADKGNPRSFRETYDENLKEGLAFQDERRNASTAGKVVGTTAGLVTGMKLPAIGKSSTSRILGNAAVSAVDEGTRGQDMIDLERGGVAGVTSGGITAAIEGLPIVGKPLGYAGKKMGNLLFGVGEESTERYLANPEKMRKVISEGSDGLRSIKDRVDEAYHNRVTKLREEAAAGLIDAKEAKKEATRLHQDYVADLKNVKPSEGLTDDVIRGVKSENDKLTEYSSKAYDTLDGTSFNRDEILDKIQKIRGGLLVDGKAPSMGDSAPAWGVLNKLEEAVKSNVKPGFDIAQFRTQDIPGIAGKDLKRLIQQLDQESSAAYTTYGSRGAAKHIKKVRDDIDPILKSNDDYKTAMVPTAEQAKLVSQLTKVFGNPEKARKALLLSADPEKGENIRLLVKSIDLNNKTNISEGLEEYLSAQKLLRDPEASLAARRARLDPAEQSLENAKKVAKDADDTRRSFNRVSPGSSEGTIERVGRDRNFEGEKQLRELLGESGVEDVKDYSLGRDFVTDKTRGAKRTAAGAIVGGAVGSLFGPAGGAVGTMAGGTAGAAIDKQGGKIWQAILDGSIKVGPYAKVLEKAAKDGPRSLGVTHLMLMQTYPDYKAAVEESENK